MTTHPIALTAGVPARISGGTAVLRPLRPGEVQPLTAVFDGLSADSRSERYLTPVPRLTSDMLRVLAAVDGRDHVAWLASVDGRPAGIARYIRVGADAAEVAFEVVDDLHGRGLGAGLLDAVTTVASASGVRRLQAVVSPSNRASVHLLAQVGLSFRHASGVLEADMAYHLLDPPRVDRPAVVRLAFDLRAGRDHQPHGVPPTTA